MCQREGLRGGCGAGKLQAEAEWGWMGVTVQHIWIEREIDGDRDRDFVSRMRK